MKIYKALYKKMSAFGTIYHELGHLQHKEFKGPAGATGTQSFSEKILEMYKRYGGVEV